MKKLLLTAICALSLLASCDTDPRGKVTPDSQPNADKDYNVKLLFEVDGVKVYKFYDSRSVYFTVPSGETYYEETHTHHHGKGSTTTTTDRVECITAKTKEE